MTAQYEQHYSIHHYDLKHATPHYHLRTTVATTTTTTSSTAPEPSPMNSFPSDSSKLAISFLLNTEDATTTPTTPTTPRGVADPTPTAGSPNGGRHGNQTLKKEEPAEGKGDLQTFRKRRLDEDASTIAAPTQITNLGASSSSELRKDKRQKVSSSSRSSSFSSSCGTAEGCNTPPPSPSPSSVLLPSFHASFPPTVLPSSLPHPKSPPPMALPSWYKSSGGLTPATTTTTTTHTTQSTASLPPSSIFGPYTASMPPSYPTLPPLPPLPLHFQPYTTSTTTTTRVTTAPFTATTTTPTTYPTTIMRGHRRKNNDLEDEEDSEEREEEEEEEEEAILQRLSDESEEEEEEEDGGVANFRPQATTFTPHPYTDSPSIFRFSTTGPRKFEVVATQLASQLGRRNRWNSFQRSELEKRFKENPWPDAATKQAIAARISMTPAQVATWFQNKRARNKDAIASKQRTRKGKEKKDKQE